MPYRQAPPHLPSGRRCPSCGGDLEHESLGPTAAERCPACRGLWIAAAEFNALLVDLDRQDAVRVRELDTAPRGHRGGYRACPRCGQFMNQANFGRSSGVVVDTCKKHGIWLDHGELRSIVDFLAEREATDDLHTEPTQRPQPSPTPAPVPARPRMSRPAPASHEDTWLIDKIFDFLLARR
ncbi:zf-TFIIB domain-containing protein [Haliangium sp.]|uniref:TFIIB-type zinc ribbon-containing protein n=1 Tax=Haliangium sp. TaxID=2663208 RepID=UPI003D141170